MSNQPEPFTADELRHMREYLEYQQTPITLRDINDKLDALMSEEQDERDKLDQRVDIVWEKLFPLDRPGGQRSEHLTGQVRDAVRALLKDLRDDFWVDKDTFEKLVREGDARVGANRYVRIAGDDDAVLVPKATAELAERVANHQFTQFPSQELFPKVWDNTGTQWRPIDGSPGSWTDGTRTLDGTLAFTTLAPLFVSWAGYLRYAKGYVAGIRGASGGNGLRS